MGNEQTNEKEKTNAKDNFAKNGINLNIPNNSLNLPQIPEKTVNNKPASTFSANTTFLQLRQQLNPNPTYTNAMINQNYGNFVSKPTPYNSSVYIKNPVKNEEDNFVSKPNPYNSPVQLNPNPTYNTNARINQNYGNFVSKPNPYNSSVYIKNPVKKEEVSFVSKPNPYNSPVILVLTFLKLLFSFKKYSYIKNPVKNEEVIETYKFRDEV